MTYREQGDPGSPPPDSIPPEPKLQVVLPEPEPEPEPWTILGALDVVESCWGSNQKHGTN